jgi:hypothetical protein
MLVSELNPLEVGDRPTIEEGSEIIGGVLLTRVGVVVDLEENPKPYLKAMEMVDGWLEPPELEWEEPNTVKEILLAVDRAAKRYAPTRIRYYEEFLAEQAKLRGVDRLTNQDQIGLSSFILDREVYGPVGGICHQRTLLTASLICMLQNRGILGGSVSVQSGRPNPQHPDRHTSVSFIDGEEEFVLDAASGLYQIKNGHLIR